MENLLQPIIFGILGGLLRALVGIVKYFEKNKRQKEFGIWYLVFSLIVSAIVGAVAGVMANTEPKFAFIAGYAGTDFIEGLYKIRMRQGFEI